ncbi:hypothetical protein OF83DRAFT_1043322, partial [Amylostereum chailletii]
SSSLAIAYEIHPPQDTAAPRAGMGPSATHVFAIEPASDAEAGYKEYYAGLRRAIAEARETTGEALTAWRDAVGNRELKKEGRPVKTVEDEDEDEDDEE